MRGVKQARLALFILASRSVKPERAAVRVRARQASLPFPRVKFRALLISWKTDWGSDDW